MSDDSQPSAFLSADYPGDHLQWPGKCPAVGAVLLAGACGYGIYHGVQASKTYEMVVKNGTGSGCYKAGEAVEIHADIPEGEHFTKWKAEGISLSEEESQDAKLTLNMPSEAVRLTALYLLYHN